MTADAIVERLGELLGTGPQVPEDPGKGDSHALVPADRWHQACKVLRSDAALHFDFLRSLCGVDRADDGAIEIVAHLFSYRHRQAFVLKTRTGRDSPRIDSVADVWPAAIWHERETFDLLGVDFTGNPDLRRILLPDDWVGHPLRKDYQEQESYRGIPTSRPGYEK